MAPSSDWPCLGVDFTSAPSRRKPVALAEGVRRGDCVHLVSQHDVPTHEALAERLARPGPWVGGFDLPFGLPRELVQALGWPTDWRDCMAHYAALPRPQIRDLFAAFCASRPAGSKFAHRACDLPAGSSPSMKWVNPPVAWMLHAGVPLLLQAGVELPAHEAPADPGPTPSPSRRVALEAYPGLLAREVVGRQSYKSDDVRRQSAERRKVRQMIVQALQAGRTRLGLSLELDRAQAAALVEDAQGDRLDAVLCLVQAAWSAAQPRWGLPVQVDPLEGWIATA